MRHDASSRCPAPCPSPRSSPRIRRPYFPRPIPAKYGHVLCSNSVPEQQLSAKLNCLYGNFNDRLEFSTPDDDNEDHVSFTVHEYARSSVYDLRRYNDGNFWGPFESDGSQDVDWERIEAIMILISYNFGNFTKIHFAHGSIVTPTWQQPFAGLTPKAWMRQPTPPLEMQDPYDLTGDWTRVVCFLDYSDLFSFNFSPDQPPIDRPRHPINTEEAIRFITMSIRVTKLTEPGEEDGRHLPVAHFSGKSSLIRPLGDPHTSSGIRGIVRLTPQGEVRWTSWSVFHGEERWRSEGVQVGGVGSARGVIGTWFDKDYDQHGPAGPTAHWKVKSEKEVLEKLERKGGVEEEQTEI
ncbi:MAG: hypothetical protein Q9190_002591 [Brigantiaea leucoxantha]